MKHGGKYAILVILLVAAALGSFGWVFQLFQGRRAREAWGTANSMAIRYGDGAELFRLTSEAPAESKEHDIHKLELGPDTVYASKGANVMSARDLVYYRQALVDDHAFAWDAPPPDSASDWSYALELKDDKTTCTLAFDFSRRVVRLVETGKELRLEKLTAEKLENFLREQYLQAMEREAAAAQESKGEKVEK